MDATSRAGTSRPAARRRAVAVCALALLAGSPLAPAQVPAGGGAGTAAPLALDFEQAQARLEQVSDALAGADAQVRGKQDLAAATRHLRLPEISLDARQLQFQKSLSLPLGSLAPVAEAFGIPSPLRFQERDWRLRPSLTAVLPLYTGGQIPAAQGAADAALRQAQAERLAQAQTLTVQLVQAYFGQRLAQQVAEVRREVGEGLRRHLEDAGKLEREGFATRAQWLQAKVASDKAEREHAKALNDLASASATLALLLRSEAPVDPRTPLFVRSRPLEPAETFVRTALARHPQIERLRALGEQAGAGVRVEQAKLKPQVFLFGQYDLYRQDALLTDSDWAFGIGLKYTFLSGSDRPRQISAAREQLHQAEAGLREAENQLRIGVTRAWNEVENARRQYLLLESSIEQARENLRLQTLSFREGQSTSLDVIDARLALGGALAERAQAAYQYDVALAQLLEVGGQAHLYPDYLREADQVISP